MRFVGSLAALGLCLFVAGCQGGEKAKGANYDTGLKELKKTDEVVGEGKEAEVGDIVYVLYRGTLLKDGKFFDGNMDDAESKMPFPVNLGAGGVIKGWEDGIPGMKEGGKRILEIPSELGYAASGSGETIPPHADLKFEVEAKYVLKKGNENRVDLVDNEVGTGAAAKAGDTVSIHYKGTYLTGKVWDDSRERGKPATFPLKVTEESMPGLIYGLEGMKVGGKRTLVLAPAMVFGMSGTEAVQGNQPVKIEVELLSVNGAGA